MSALTQLQLALRERLHQAVEEWTPVDGLVYRGPADFLLQHGRWYRVRQGKTFAPRSCFGNALFLAGVHAEARYVEGVAVTPEGHLPHHAWVVEGERGYEQGYEVTWPIVGLAYFGVEFSYQRADNCTWEGDATVIDDDKRGWPLLRQRWHGEPAGLEWPDNVRLQWIRKVRDGDATPADYLHVLGECQQEVG